jgi:hypothetical protein
VLATFPNVIDAPTGHDLWSGKKIAGNSTQIERANAQESVHDTPFINALA